jgi:polysaccharide deacetylase family sporulation protein PdaB
LYVSPARLYSCRLWCTSFRHTWGLRFYPRIPRFVAASPHPGGFGSAARGRQTRADAKRGFRSAIPAARQIFILQGSSQKRQVALTFDDAPDDRFTPQILDMLKRNGVRATFFIVGSRADKHPESVRRILREGHVIGNHSYSHPNFQKLGNTRFRNEVLAANRSIRHITGRSPKLIRPPYGNVNEEQIKWLASRNFKIINWNVDSLDWKGLSARQVTRNVLDQTKAGSIILQHAGGGVGEDLTGTVQALPAIIRKLREQGMEFVTVPELLGIPAY